MIQPTLTHSSNNVVLLIFGLLDTILHQWHLSGCPKLLEVTDGISPGMLVVGFAHHGQLLFRNQNTQSFPQRSKL